MSSTDVTLSIETRQKEAIKSIANANIPKSMADRETVLADTLSFLENFKRLSTVQVKQLTLMRQLNQNKDMRLVPLHKIPDADALADVMDSHYHTAEVVVLMDREPLPYEKPAVVPTID